MCLTKLAIFNSTRKRCKFVTNVWYVKNILANCDGNMYLPILHLLRLRVELHCKLQEKLHRVTGPLQKQCSRNQILTDLQDIKSSVATLQSITHSLLSVINVEKSDSPLIDFCLNLSPKSEQLITSELQRANADVHNDTTELGNMYAMKACNKSTTHLQVNSKALADCYNKNGHKGTDVISRDPLSDAVIYGNSPDSLIVSPALVISSLPDGPDRR